LPSCFFFFWFCDPDALIDAVEFLETKTPATWQAF